MQDFNRCRNLNFADEHLEAVLIDNVENASVSGIVVNLSDIPIFCKRYADPLLPLVN